MKRTGKLNVMQQVSVPSSPTLCATSRSKRRNTPKRNDQNQKKGDVTITNSVINGKSHKTMADSGSDFTFMSKAAAEQSNLYIFEPSEERANITLADDRSSPVIGETVADVIVNGRLYLGLVVSVMDKLCVDVVLGTQIYDF